ncbi:MAG: hypothetical protein HZC40_14965 [Chloroflexi bacterium]|nr:hypothetical protein [Chloroflexota bacterium]
MQNSIQPAPRHWWLPSIPVIVFAVIFLASLVFMPQMLNGDGDLGRHLTVGALILETGTIPMRDLFSHTLPDAPVIPHEWLAQVLFAFAYRVANLNGVAWLAALALAATYAVLTWGLERAGVRALFAGLLAGFASMMSSLHQLTRPHIFSWLFFILFLIILEEDRRAGRRAILFLLLPLTIVWANLHSMFVTGLMLVLFYALGALLERKRHAFELGALALGMFALAGMHPSGWAVPFHLFEYTQSRFLLDLTVEHQSPNFHHPNVWLFAGWLILSLVVGGRTHRALAWTQVVVLGAWTGLALYAARNIPLYALASALVVGPALDQWIAQIPRLDNFLARTDLIARQSWGWMWAALFCALLIALNALGFAFGIGGKANAFDPRVFPVAAVDHLARARLTGNLFNEFTWGGYLLYRSWPPQRVFIDGFTDFYGEALTREYWQTIQGESNWEAILDRYAVEWVIVRADARLIARLRESSRWVESYRDETAAIWRRR